MTLNIIPVLFGFSMLMMTVVIGGRVRVLTPPEVNKHDMVTKAKISVVSSVKQSQRSSTRSDRSPVVKRPRGGPYAHGKSIKGARAAAGDGENGSWARPTFEKRFKGWKTREKPLGKAEKEESQPRNAHSLPPHDHLTV